MRNGAAAVLYPVRPRRTGFKDGIIDGKRRHAVDAILEDGTAEGRCIAIERAGAQGNGPLAGNARGVNGPSPFSRRVAGYGSLAKGKCGDTHVTIIEHGASDGAATDCSIAADGTRNESDGGEVLITVVINATAMIGSPVTAQSAVNQPQRRPP